MFGLWLWVIVCVLCRGHAAKCFYSYKYIFSLFSLLLLISLVLFFCGFPTNYKNGKYGAKFFLSACIEPIAFIFCIHNVLNKFSMMSILARVGKKVNTQAYTLTRANFTTVICIFLCTFPGIPSAFRERNLQPKWLCALLSGRDEPYFSLSLKTLNNICLSFCF